MTGPKPRWSRRKDARPAEIVDAAMDVFVEKGFAAARLDEIARRSGVAKGTLYLYFATKEDVFRAVARQAFAANLAAIEQATAAFHGSLGEIVPVILMRAADTLGDRRIPAIVRMVIADSHAFPDLARIWHDDVVSRLLVLLTGLVAAAQARGEVRAGDPQLHALSILGPMLMGLLFREVFGGFSPHTPKLEALAAQHAETILRGLLVSSEPAPGAEREPAPQ